MKRCSGAAGFYGRAAPVASPRLMDAVAALLAIGALSLCLIVALTVLANKIGMAISIPAEPAFSFCLPIARRGG